MKQYINTALLFSWLSQCLRYSLLLSVMVGGVNILILLVAWSEFSATYQAISVNLTFSAHSTSLMAIVAGADNLNTNNIQLILSSRDKKVLESLFFIWQLSYVIVLIASACLLVLRMTLFWRLSLLMLLCSGVIVNVYQLLEYVNSTDLIMITILWCVTVIAYLNVAHFLCYLPQTMQKNTLIAYASQSGTAKNIAYQMAKSSQINCDIQPFSQLTPKNLLGYQQLFVVASTYGDGQAPEKAMGFSQALANCQESLHHLNYAVLALGDSAYPKFCAFGHTISSLLSNRGARLIQPVQEIDRGDNTVVGQWWHHICEHLGWQKGEIATTWSQATIVSNICLNEQQHHRPAHAITLAVDNINYRAGDLLEVLTPVSSRKINEKLVALGLSPKAIVQLNGKNIQLSQALRQLEWTDQVSDDPQELIELLPALQPRVYSIASAPNCAEVQLLVRQLIKDNASLGFSSSALCHSQTNDTFEVAVRAHDSFCLPEKGSAIIMIAAGTGIAPFMSFLAQRQHEAMGECWLMFGEQYSEHDSYFKKELTNYLTLGILNRLDYAFSRDKTWLQAQKPRYVDDIIRQQKEQLMYWLDEKDAHIYVCGNKKGLGESVKMALKQLLKEDYKQLLQSEKLHFDLY